MRIIVFFDLPTITDSDKREYRKFRKLLIKNGFIMMQESVYSKMALNKTVETSVISLLKNNKPPSGLVQVISITEKQYSNMINISGEISSNIIDSDSRLIVL